MITIRSGNNKRRYNCQSLFNAAFQVILGGAIVTTALLFLLIHSLQLHVTQSLCKIYSFDSYIVFSDVQIFLSFPYRKLCIFNYFHFRFRFYIFIFLNSSLIHRLFFAFFGNLLHSAGSFFSTFWVIIAHLFV